MGERRFLVDLPAGLATVIGALPAVGLVQMTRLVADTFPKLPSAPAIRIDPHVPLDVSESADLGVETFLQELIGRVDPIALTITGPITLMLQLVGLGLDRAEAQQLASSAVVERSRRVLALASDYLPEAPVVLFLEEPGLSNSMHPSFPVAPDDIASIESGVVGDLEADAMVGVQVSGRADWAMLMTTGISVLGAPLTARLDTVAAELGTFLERGGFIAWGAVPTDEPLGASVDRLWRRLNATWCDLVFQGLDPVLLRERSIITPAAGLAEFGLSQAERVMRLTAELSDRVLQQAFGVRLSLGS